MNHILFGDHTTADVYNVLDPRSDMILHIGNYVYPTLLHYLFADLAMCNGQDSRSQIVNLKLEELIQFFVPIFQSCLTTFKQQDLSNTPESLCYFWSGKVVQSLLKIKSKLVDQPAFYYVLKSINRGNLLEYSVDDVRLNEILGRMCPTINVFGLALSSFKESVFDKPNVDINKLLTKFPSLQEWVLKKGKNVSRNIAVFSSYLFQDKNMDTFSKVVYSVRDPSNPKKNITVDTREITDEMAHYLIEHIYNCKLNSIFQSSTIPDKWKEIFYKEMSSIVQLPEDKIQNRVYQTIWEYITTLAITFSLFAKTDDEVVETIKKMELEVTKEGMTNLFIDNWGMGNNILNAAFQAVMNVSISLCDWINTNEIGIQEIQTAQALIIQSLMTQSPNDIYNDNIVASFRKQNFIITTEALAECSKIISSLSQELKLGELTLVEGKNERLTKMLNRIMFFACTNADS